MRGVELGRRLHSEIHALELLGGLGVVSDRHLREVLVGAVVRLLLRELAGLNLEHVGDGRLVDELLSGRRDGVLPGLRSIGRILRMQRRRERKQRGDPRE